MAAGRDPRPLRAGRPLSNYAELRAERVGELHQQRSSIAPPCASVHASERVRLERGQLLDDWPRPLRVGVVVERRTECLAGTEDVGFDERGLAAPGLREQIAAEESSRGLVGEIAAFPSVR